MTKVLTANRLRDGMVVYLDRHGGWSTRFEDSRIAGDKDEEEQMLVIAETAVAARRVVAPYLFAVARGDDGIAPIGTRERIRASGGPTVTSAPAEYHGVAPE